MPVFSRASRSKLYTLDNRLARVLEEAINIVDFKIVCGHREEQEQNRLYALGRSKLKWPRSKHNSWPSMAVDVVPYPLNHFPNTRENRSTYTKDIARFYYLAGTILTVAHFQKISLRWGGDWDRDKDFTDQTFDDLLHFELVQ